MSQLSICVFGVSGVGKSSLLHTAAELCSPTASIIRGSTILKESFGVASYEALESISAQEKKQTLLRGIASTVTSSDSRIIIIDTHLVVPMHSAIPFNAEDMWDDQLLKLFHGFIYISAPPKIIAERRRMDAERSLRAMRATTHICAEDLRINAKRWDEVSPEMVNKKVIINDQTVLVGARKIIHFLNGLS